MRIRNTGWEGGGNVGQLCHTPHREGLKPLQINFVTFSFPQQNDQFSCHCVQFFLFLSFLCSCRGYIDFVKKCKAQRQTQTTALYIYILDLNYRCSNFSLSISVFNFAWRTYCLLMQTLHKFERNAQDLGLLIVQFNTNYCQISIYNNQT